MHLPLAGRELLTVLCGNQQTDNEWHIFYAKDIKSSIWRLSIVSNRLPSWHASNLVDFSHPSNRAVQKSDIRCHVIALPLTSHHRRSQ